MTGTTKEHRRRPRLPTSVPPGDRNDQGAPPPTATRTVHRLGAAILRAMRLSHLFFTSLRDDPAEAEMPSHRLL
ncbi:MAG TPA: hypothetical protein VM344_10610, partial [Vitreimonas sp.]|nr:hypothetical protein [Vitreimonas sp.]